MELWNKVKGAFSGGQPKTQAAYEAASPAIGIFGGGYSADTEISNSLPTVRNNVREQVRNNPRASAARDAWVRNVIGSGIKPNFRIQSKKDRDIISQKWEQFVAECDADGNGDFYALQALVGTANFESGEVLARKRIRTKRDGLFVPLQIQLMECDHLDDHKTIPNKRLSQGIQFNNKGARTHYHIFPEHPGNMLDMNAERFRSFAVKAQDIAHVFRATRPGQNRGMPHLHAALVTLKQLGDYETAELDRKKTAASLLGTIENELGNEVSLIDIFGDGSSKNQGMVATANRQNHYEDVNDLERNSMVVLAPGDKLKIFQSTDVAVTFEIAQKNYLHLIAAACGVTYEQLTGDTSNSSFSSYRMSRQEVQRGMRMEQKRIAQQFCTPVFKWFMEVLILSGVELEGYNEDTAWKYEHPIWVPEPHPYVDPLKDGMADLLDARAGFRAIQQIQAERGIDPDEVDRQIARKNKAWDELGIVSDADPRKTQKNGALQDIAAAIDAIDSLDDREEEGTEDE